MRREENKIGSKEEEERRRRRREVKRESMNPGIRFKIYKKKT